MSQRSRNLIILLVVFAVAPTFAGIPARGSAKNPVLSRYWVQPDEEVMVQVAEAFEVVAKRVDGYEIIVPARDRAKLLAWVPNARLLQRNIDHAIDRAGASRLAGYHTWEKVEAHLKKLVAAYPAMVSLETYGKSEDGRPLYALQLTSQIKANADKPEVLMTAATHGNELVTVEVLFGVLDKLVQNYGKPGAQRSTDIVDNHRLYFVPVVNPDGYAARARYANGIDPNREYPYPGNERRKPNAAIQGMMDLVGKHSFKASLDYHSSGGYFMYPWSYTRDTLEPAVEKTFSDLTEKMAATNHYRHGQISHVLYVAWGGSVDYFYWKHKMFAIAAEIGNTNTPSASALPTVVSKQMEAAWLFLEAF